MGQLVPIPPPMPRNPQLEAIGRNLLKTGLRLPPQEVVDSRGKVVAIVTFLHQPDQLTPEPKVEGKPERRLDFSL